MSLRRPPPPGSSPGAGLWLPWPAGRGSATVSVPAYLCGPLLLKGMLGAIPAPQPGQPIRGATLRVAFCRFPLKSPSSSEG